MPWTDLIPDAEQHWGQEGHASACLSHGKVGEPGLVQAGGCCSGGFLSDCEQNCKDYSSIMGYNHKSAKINKHLIL